MPFFFVSSNTSGSVKSFVISWVAGENFAHYRNKNMTLVCKFIYKKGHFLPHFFCVRIAVLSFTLWCGRRHVFLHYSVLSYGQMMTGLSALSLSDEVKSDSKLGFSKKDKILKKIRRKWVCDVESHIEVPVVCYLRDSISPPVMHHAGRQMTTQECC
jgi:hypothetical protein